MQELFDAKNGASLIDFYGAYPEGDKNFSIVDNGMVYRAVSNLVRSNSDDLVPILNTWKIRDGDVSFFLFHFPTKLLLRYTSQNSFRGVWYSFEDIYYEGLDAFSGNCSEAEFKDNLSRLSFLEKDFNKLVKKTPSVIAPEERVKNMLIIEKEQANALHELSSLVG